MANKELINRLKIEHDDLLYKCTSLEIFINSDKFNRINYIQQLLLPIQLDTMSAYLTILEARLHDLEEPFND